MTLNNLHGWHLVAACLVILAANTYSASVVAEGTPDEATLIQVLESSAGWPEKQEACRALRGIGTEACIPALAALLPDEHLSHMARYALEPMPYAAASQALREALPQLQGMQKTGAIISLGVRRDVESAPLLCPLLADPDSNIARAAAGALGRIATPDAVDALRKAYKAATRALYGAVAEGLLAAGERLVAGGEADAAAAIYEELLAPGAANYVHLGAFRGLAAAKPAEAPQRIVQALKGDDPGLRDLAAQLVAETTDSAVVNRYASTLPELPVAGQVALLRGLADRSDAAARPAVVDAMQSANPDVRIAAVSALGAVGDAENVPLLIDLLGAGEDALSEAARISLTILKGGDVDNVIAAAVPETAPEVRARLLALLAARRAAQTVPLAVASFADANLAVRIAALEVIADNGNADQAPAVVAVVLKTPEGDEQSAARKALNRIASRYGDAVLPVVLDAMNGATVESRSALLGTVALVRSPKALETMLAALNDADAQVASKALNLLSNWPTLDAAPHLLELAKSEDASRHVLGLRGYVRLAQDEPDGGKRIGMLTEATALAGRADEKKLVLAAWGKLPAADSIRTLQPFLDDPQVKTEAALAILGIAIEVGKWSPENKALVLETAQLILTKFDDVAIKERVQNVQSALQ